MRLIRTPKPGKQEASLNFNPNFSKPSDSFELIPKTLNPNP